MKQLLIFVLTIFCFTVMSAHNSSVFNTKANIIINDVRNFNFEVDESKLSDTLKIDRFKTYDILDIHEEFCRKMTEASLVSDKDKQNELIMNSIDYELLYIRDLLTPEQYRIFVKWFNQALKDRGFEEVLVQKSKKQFLS